MKDRIEVDVGDFNPVLGKSYAEIAGISRSMHRSQGMGAPERRGVYMEAFVTIAGDTAKRDLFDEIDLSWNRIPGRADIGRLLAHAIEHLNPAHPELTIPDLLAARQQGRRRAGGGAGGSQLERQGAMAGGPGPHRRHHRCADARR